MPAPINPTAYAELNTDDPERARQFYENLFQWTSEQEATPVGPYITFQGILAGITAPRGGVPQGWLPYVNVADVAVATSRARELGAEVIRDCVSIEPGTFSVIRDPTGCVLGLWQGR